MSQASSVGRKAIETGEILFRLPRGSYCATKLSWNLGLGADFRTYWDTSWFIEAQYRRIQTPQPIEYWPVTVGIRF